MANIGVVYSTNSKLIRRIIVPDNDAELSDPLHVGEGESIFVMDRKDPADLPSLQQRIADLHDIDLSDIPSGRCVFLDKDNLVASVLMADPEIDTHPEYSLMASDRANEGWKYDEGKFLARYAVVTPIKEEFTDQIAVFKDAVVEDVIWQDPDDIKVPEGKQIFEHSNADVGESIKIPVLIEAASEGTLKI